MIDVLDVVLRAVALWRLTRLLVVEEGPFLLAEKLRRVSGVTSDDPPSTSNTWTPLWCHWCTSVWLAPLVWLIPKPFAYVLSLSGLASVLHLCVDLLERKGAQ